MHVLQLSATDGLGASDDPSSTLNCSVASDKATEVVFIALLDRIVSGQIDAGSTLPGETALAQEFGESSRSS